MAKAKDVEVSEETPAPDHVEEPDNHPSDADNAPHGRRVQGIN